MISKKCPSKWKSDKQQKNWLSVFLKDSVLLKYDVIDRTVKTQYLLKPQHKMSMQSLTKEILVAFKELQDLSICLGIFEHHWVSACQHYNLNNVYKEKQGYVFT